MAQAKRSTGRESVQDALRKISRNPIHLRVLLAVFLVGGWYVGIYKTLMKRIEEARSTVQAIQTKLELAEQIESLREEVDRIEPRIPETADPNESYQYMLKGVQSLPVNVSALSPSTTTNCGPYKVLTFQLTATGAYEEIDELLRWIENNPRVMRVDMIDIQTAKEASGNESPSATVQRFTINLTILKIMGMA